MWGVGGGTLIFISLGTTCAFYSFLLKLVCGALKKKRGLSQEG